MIQVRVKFFGAMAEKAGITEEMINLAESGYEIDKLIAFCMDRYRFLEEDSMQVAVNQTLNRKKTLENGDEIAFLPPFAGG